MADNTHDAPPIPPVDQQHKTHDKQRYPLTAWFLGPKAELSDVWVKLFDYILQDYIHWRRNYFPSDPIVVTHHRRRGHEQWLDDLNGWVDRLLGDLKGDFPFHSPRYIAHMLSEQTLPSVLGHLAGMLYNPNNVTDEAAPITVKMELEVGHMIAEMLGFHPKRSWAHLCSGGTTANLEALWVARTAQFTALSIRDFCRTENLAFTIKTPNGRPTAITDLDNSQLLGLRPNELIYMRRKLAAHMTTILHRRPREVLEQLNAAMDASPYNVTRRGLPSVLAAVGASPVIIASAASHYSIKKTANILGYGEDCVIAIPVDASFRMNTSELRRTLWNLPPNTYVAAVVGILGTTEEGAIDPIHLIRELRDELGRERNRSYWLHIDAAWGGYIRSLFCGHDLPRESTDTLETTCQRYCDAIDATETFTVATHSSEHTKTVRIGWKDYGLYKSFIAVEGADSVTIDPHKMGYVPYPAGAIVFRNSVVCELVTQKAQYISDASAGTSGIDLMPTIDAIGPYILEGSKPGAAAASCWLAHKAIPLTVGGHGKIVRTTLLNARKLTRYLRLHREMYPALEHAAGRPFSRHGTAISFTPLTEPDTNIVCFIATPFVWSGGQLVRADRPLAYLNRFNRAIYARLSIKPTQGASSLPYMQPFFVSRTVLTHGQYTADSMRALLSSHRITPADYRAEGLFILRATVMNPLHFEAYTNGKDYLLDFVAFLHEVARDIHLANPG